MKTYTEQLQQLWEQMRIDIANKVRKIDTQSDVRFKTIILDGFDSWADLGGSSAVLTEVGENNLFDDNGYSYDYGVLNYEQLAELTDYINTL